MKNRQFITIDGNEAVASVAYQLNEIIALYPITPASPMGEWADAWAAAGMPNMWGTVPSVIEMQSEGGAAGAIHGALQTGALSTTFTASQGLLLMIPNMYKIAGELTPFVLHVAARSLAAQALSIFGDHSDVMAARATGFALLCAASVQEAQDFTLIAHAATLRARIPFLFFFDGFRTSHEIAKIESLSETTIGAMIDEERIREHRMRALSPDHPVVRGTAQNPDVYFQARETVNRFYNACPEIVQYAMDSFAELTGRSYHVFDYHGADDAERGIVVMGSGCESVEETVDYLIARGEKVGLLKVRLYRPFDVRKFSSVLPPTVKAVAVLDRTKEPGSAGEPLYLDCVTALQETARPNVRIVGGRYGLSSKDLTPGMIKATFDNLNALEPRNHFSIGIHDDVTGTSLDFNQSFSIEADDVFRAIFYGLGSDGTVGANKESIKIIGENTPFYAQAYFVYDSKKAGSMTISHLRFGPRPIRSSYLIAQANFVACHQPEFLDRYSVFDQLIPHGKFLLNTPYPSEEVWSHLPQSAIEQLVDKRPRFYAIDAHKVARECGMGGRINTIMQTCFFAISEILPRDQSISAIKEHIRKAYESKGNEIVQRNLNAVDKALSHVVELQIPQSVPVPTDILTPALKDTPAFVREVIGKMLIGRGDQVPVSALPVDGTFPTGTSRWEKRNLAQEVPVWEPDLCIQCGKCVMVCPHAVIRSKVYDPTILNGAPETFKSREARLPEWKGLNYTLQVAVEDCTGCAICVDVCPVRSKSEARTKAINMRPQLERREGERNNWDFFLRIPERERRELSFANVRESQVAQALFEFSGACAGCGETPYIKLLTQLFGDRLLIANATGCSSIYGGNLPTTPYAAGSDGLGPAWSNSLFEDNAEFGLGMRLAVDQQNHYAREMLGRLSGELGDALVQGLLDADQGKESGIQEQRSRVLELKKKLVSLNSQEAAALSAVADSLVQKSVWLLGGDGWAYDIGFGGLDHVLGSGRNVNVLVLDTEVYSNTGGQMSKATPRAAVAKFATGGKRTSKKDLAMEAVSYGSVYVARVAMGANDTHTVKAFLEAEAHDGPSLIIAYSHCIAHGYDMSFGLDQQKKAVLSGYWPLMRYNPALRLQGKNPFQLDSKAPSIPLKQYAYQEARYTMLVRSNPEAARELLRRAQDDVEREWRVYSGRAAMAGRSESPHIAPVEPEAAPEPV